MQGGFLNADLFCPVDQAAVVEVWLSLAVSVFQGGDASQNSTDENMEGQVCL